MSQADFYHLTRGSLVTALPPLLGRTLAAGARALVLCPSLELVETLDAALWRCPNPDWLPHGTPAGPEPHLQPIYLTTGPENPAAATFLFQLDGAVCADPAPFIRVFDLFDGNDTEKSAAARDRWRNAKQSGRQMAYWQQSETGWRKAG